MINKNNTFKKEIGFDNELYLKLQSKNILDRIKKFKKLYLEFGGKLFDDLHAARVLPGFNPNIKTKLLVNLKDKLEIIFCISANDIEKNKIRADLGLSYDNEMLRIIDNLRDLGLYVSSIVITLFKGQPSAIKFAKKLENHGEKVYFHQYTKGYPSEVDVIVSDEGYGANPYIQTTKPLIVVTAPGPGSGKMATCLSQLYHDQKRGIKAGYAKFETFPIWNLPLKHPVNMAYEAATVDLSDVNMIDPFYLEATGKTAVNYNRDIEIYPVLQAIFEKIYGKCPYNSPTEMGVNMSGYCITDDDAACQASKSEIIRRYYETLCRKRNGNADSDEILKLELIMKQVGVVPEDRKVVSAALKKAEVTGAPAAAIELPDGTVVTGKTSNLLGPSAAALLNALKKLGGISDSLILLPPVIIEPIQKLKINNLGNRNPRLHADEILIALAISATTSPIAALALEQLPKLRECEAHVTVILSEVDKNVYRKLGLNLTCEPVYATKKLYHK